MLPTHKSCLFNKTCLLCIPEFRPTNTYLKYDRNEIGISNFSDNVDSLSEPPYFTPFNEIGNNDSHDLIARPMKFMTNFPRTTKF